LVLALLFPSSNRWEPSGELVSKVRLEFLSWLADTVDSYPDQKDLEHDLGDCCTVKELLVQLARVYPRFEKSVFDIRGLSLNAAVAIFVNGRQIELENGLETMLKDGDSLVFVPLVAGGR
jgi:MoaD family protein